eukprot:CAMPEP_0183744402 /NCGR_PEP_ID=MMETSP0737-20130205/65710_1 /TAXON_ID=385413 /ORGANISM="Thalassiosira miniscula, Strain CCMP1093" /LENGTH=402 /DNA_ID=CAMNT_0025980043 /DNA_START=57 /DNA_END=1265 /DNA_ORIENTATION=+
MVARLQALILCAVSIFLPHGSCFVPSSTKNAKLLTQFSQRPSSFHLLGHRDATNGDNEESHHRRRILLSAPAAALLLPSSIIGSNSNSNVANAAETPAETIRLLSSKTIPGLGPPDIYYPSYFVGKWKVTKIIATSDDNFWNDPKLKSDGVSLPLTLVSEMRFVPYDAGKDFTDGNNGGDGSSNPNDVPAIADRAFNERSYYASLANTLNSSKSKTTKASMPSIQSLNWTPTNPNVLSLAYADGSSKEVKVTKRSSDVSADGSGVFSSEFRRVTDVPSSEGVAGGIPKIYKSRLLTKWKRGNEEDSGGDVVNLIEGIEILYNEQGTFGDMSADPLGGSMNSAALSSLYGQNTKEQGTFGDMSADPLGGSMNSAALSSLYGQNTKDVAVWRSTKTKILMERIV